MPPVFQSKKLILICGTILVMASPFASIFTNDSLQKGLKGRKRILSLQEIERFEEQLKNSFPKYEISFHPDTPKEIRNSHKKALSLVYKYGSSPKFYKYISSRVTGFAHTDLKVDEVLEIFQKQLAAKKEIHIYSTPFTNIGNAVGAYENNKVFLNTRYKLSPEEWAGTILHETSHALGWSHDGNKGLQNDNERSFPYMVGYAFTSFLKFAHPSEVTTYYLK